MNLKRIRRSAEITFILFLVSIFIGAALAGAYVILWIGYEYFAMFPGYGPIAAGAVLAVFGVAYYFDLGAPKD